MSPYALILAAKEQVGIELIGRHGSALGSLLLIRYQSVKHRRKEDNLQYLAWQQDGHPFAVFVVGSVLIQSVENSQWPLACPCRSDVDLCGDGDGGGDDDDGRVVLVYASSHAKPRKLVSLPWDLAKLWLRSAQTAIHRWLKDPRRLICEFWQIQELLKMSIMRQASLSLA